MDIQERDQRLFALEQAAKLELSSLDEMVIAAEKFYNFLIDDVKSTPNRLKLLEIDNR